MILTKIRHAVAQCCSFEYTQLCAGTFVVWNTNEVRNSQYPYYEKLLGMYVDLKATE